MPIYEYLCSRCNERFDIRQPVGADGSQLRCPKCGAEKPQKLISTFSSIGTGRAFGIGESCSPSSGST